MPSYAFRTTNQREELKAPNQPDPHPKDEGGQRLDVKEVDP